MERVAHGPAGQLLWAAAAGLAGGGGQELSSQSTKQRGLIAAFDLTPTILDHLGVRSLPTDVRGAPLLTDGALHAASLRGLMARLRVISARRLPALGWLLGAWALLAALASASTRGRAWSLRVGALGGAVGPGRGADPRGPRAERRRRVRDDRAPLRLVLGASPHALVRWPRAPLVAGTRRDRRDQHRRARRHAAVEMLLAAGTGPDPGARFYGIGNDLKSALAVLALVAVAGRALPRQARSTGGADHVAMASCSP